MSAQAQSADRVLLAGLALCFALVLPLLGPTDSWAVYVAGTANAGNSAATDGASLWFDATGTGATICTGANTTLSCPFPARRGKTTGTFTLADKGGFDDTYTVAIVDGGGPGPLSGLATAVFASTRQASATLAAGTADTVEIAVSTKGNTPAGTYTGWVRVTCLASGGIVDVPVSVVVQ